MSLEEIKKSLGSEKMVLGTDKVMKALRAGKAKKVFLASNYSELEKKEIGNYSSKTGAELEVLEKPNDELGTFCRKPFPVAAIAILK